MNREDRAKQFAPFEALKGLREALAEKELEHEKNARRDLSDETAQEIQNNLIKLTKGDIVEVICYESGYYITVKGQVNKINIVYRYIMIGDGKIFFEDIYDIRII